MFNEEDLKEIADKIIAEEKKRINNSNWLDLTLDEISLVEDIEKRRTFRQEMRHFHIHIINPLANSVPRKFTFSVPDECLTYRIMMNDYMKYFYKKKMTREQIIEMMVKNQVITSKRGKKK